MELTWSEIDQRRFGLKTAKINLSTKTANLVTLINEFENRKGELFIIRCNASLIEEVHTLNQHNFFLTDTMLTFSKEINQNEKLPITNIGVKTIIADPHHSEIISVLAKKSFQTYKGHYHNNPFLPNQLCNEVYFEWASRLLKEPKMADAVFMAYVDSEPAGFASVKLNSENIAIGGLLGVNPKFRGKKISSALNNYRLKWCQSGDVNQIHVETSLNNRTYINILLNLGFKLSHSSYIFHKVSGI